MKEELQEVRNGESITHEYYLEISGKTWGGHISNYNYLLSYCSIPTTLESVEAIAGDFERIDSAVVHHTIIREEYFCAVIK